MFMCGRRWMLGAGRPLWCGLLLALPAGLLSANMSAAQAPAASPVAQASEAFRSGTERVRQGDLPGAATAFARAVRLAPGVGAGHSALGAVLLQQGKPQAALEQLEDALRINGADAPAMLNAGLAHAQLAADASRKTGPGAQAETVRALADFARWQEQTGLALPPDAAVAAATLLLNSAQPEKAEKTLAASLAAAPQDITLLDASGVLEAQRNHFAEARVRFETALSSPEIDIASKSFLSRLHLHLGTSLLATGDATAAETELQRATELDPAHTPALVQLGRARFTLGKQDEGLSTLRRARAADSANFDANYELALALESVGEVTESIPYFEAARKLAPGHVATLTNYGLALVQTGKAKEAVPLYLEALKTGESDATLHQDLGVAFLQQSNLNDAIAQFRRAAELDPRSGQIAYDLGLALKLRDDLPAATSAFERAIALDPSLADAPYTLGVLYMQQGRFDDAAKSLHTALQLRPENADAWSMLGSVLKQNGQPAEAADALQKAIALDAGQPGNHVNLASVLVELGRKEEAVAERRIAGELSRTAGTKQRVGFALDSANLLRQRGQFAEAITQYRSALAADPKNVAAHTALADTLEQTGAKAEAQQERARAKSLAEAEQKPR